MDVVDIGVVPTPLNYWALHHLPVVGGIQITGSHNPPEYNGFKLCVGTDSLHGDGDPAPPATRSRRAAGAPTGGATVREEDVIARYIDDIAKRIGPLSRPMRVVLDCGNGAGALVAPQLFARGSASMRRICFARATAPFPNHHPDPTVVENLEDLIAAVKTERADVGIAFDGDADRIGVIDDKGRSSGVITCSFCTRATCSRAQEERADHLRCEVLAGAAGRHHGSGRHAGHVEDRPLADQGQDEGDARAGRRRDVRAHVLRRRASTATTTRCTAPPACCASSPTPGKRRRASCWPTSRSSSRRPRFASIARRQEVRGGRQGRRALPADARRDRRGWRARPLRRRVGTDPRIQYAARSSSCCDSRRAPSSAWRRSRARWRDGCAPKASPSSVNAALVARRARIRRARAARRPGARRFHVDQRGTTRARARIGG